MAEARVFYVMTSGALTKDDMDRIIKGYMIAVPEFYSTEAQVNVITCDRIEPEGLEDPLKRLAYLIRDTNTARYVTADNALAFGKVPLSTGEMCYCAILFEGEVDGYPDALDYLSDYLDIMGIEVKLKTSFFRLRR